MNREPEAAISLSLSTNRISPRFISRFARLISLHPTKHGIDALDLRDNHIGPSHVWAFKELAQAGRAQPSRLVAQSDSTVPLPS